MIYSHKKKISSPALGRVRLKGSVAEQMERFFANRINSEDARTLVYQEAEDAFRNKLDDASGVHGIWQGEFWGKWIISAVRVCEYSGHTELKEFIRRGVHTMISMQEPSGYLGTYRDAMNIFAADPVKTTSVLGWPCNWNWSIWCRKYTLWGLLEAWRLLDEPEILEAAERLANHLICSLQENAIRLGATGTFAGIPSGSILKPMVVLYRATGNEKFLDFAREIVADWNRADGLCPNLIANAMSGKPVHEWYPNPEKWAKAYEMMSCFDGILELYRVTGEPELLEAVKRFYALLKQSEFNLLFSVGFNDIFANGTSQLNAISEPCDVIHWMRLGYELYMETGEKSYLDDFEMAFYNPFLSSVYRDGKWGARGVRSHGRHMTAFQQAGFTRNHCCVNNIPRGFMNMAQAVLTCDGNTVSVNLFTESEGDISLADGGKIKISISGNYLAAGEVNIAYETMPVGEIRLKVRIPGWATTAYIEHDGKRYPASGEWFEWPVHPGSGNVELKFERQLEIRSHQSPGEDKKWYRERWDEAGMEGMFRTGQANTMVFGPLLLARSKYLGNTEAEMFGTEQAPISDCVLHQLDSDTVRCAFEAEFMSNGQRRKTKVCDYASAGNAILNDPRFFSIYF